MSYIYLTFVTGVCFSIFLSDNFNILRLRIAFFLTYIGLLLIYLGELAYNWLS